MTVIILRIRLVITNNFLQILFVIKEFLQIQIPESKPINIFVLVRVHKYVPSVTKVCVLCIRSGSMYMFILTLKIYGICNKSDVYFVLYYKYIRLVIFLRLSLC